MTATQTAPPLMVLGLDGATWRVIRPLVDRGLMPNLGQLMDAGYHSTLISTAPPISAPAWTTFITGKNPGQHGILQFVNLRAGAPAGDKGVEIFPGGFSVVNARSIQEPTLWQHLGQAGLRVGIMNVPMTYPPEPVNGFLVTGMLTPPGADFTYPSDLADELDDGYEIDLALHEREFHFNADRLLERLVEVMEKRASTAVHLMERHTWNLFVVVFTTTDRLQHRFWKVLVPGSPEYEAPDASSYRTQLEEYHRRLDARLGELVQAAGPNAHVMVVSDHGFGPVADRAVHKQPLMRYLGLVRKGGDAPIGRLRRLVEGTLGLTVADLRRHTNRLLPRRLVSWVEAQARQAEHRVRSRDRAYLVTLHENLGGVFFNLPDADGGDGMQEDALRQSIVSRLQQLADPETGQPLVHHVYRSEEVWNGGRLDECPDLVFELAPGYGLAGGVAPGGQLVSVRRQEPEKQGTHREDGILVLAGPAIRPEAASEPEQLIDVTATILYLLRQPIPTDMDSRVISRAIDPDVLDAHPIRSTEPSRSRAPDTAVAPEAVWDSEEDARLIEDRLRGIGYLE